MLRRLGLLSVFGGIITAAVPAMSQVGTTTSPADGHTIHVTAPHVVAGKVMGPYHHYCKVLSPEPVIECLCYKAKEVADLVATTDGIIFHLWSHDDKVPSGRVIIAQSVGHVNLTQAELKKGAQKSVAAKASAK
jgi:hypothetical protein